MIHRWRLPFRQQWLRKNRTPAAEVWKHPCVCGLTTESRLRRSCLDIPTTKTAIFKSIRMKHLLLNLFSICTSTVTLPSRLPIPLPIRRAAHISENHAGHPAASYRSFATSGTAGTFLQEKPSQKTIERTGR